MFHVKNHFGNLQIPFGVPNKNKCVEGGGLRFLLFGRGDFVLVNFVLYSIQIHPNLELINPIMSYFFRECNIAEIQRKFREIFDVSPKEILLPKVSVIKRKKDEKERKYKG